MANAYDFTSGFLQARQQRETERNNKAVEEYRTKSLGIQQAELDAKAPYWQAETRYKNSQSSAQENKNRLTQGITYSVIDPLLKKLGGGSSSSGLGSGLKIDGSSEQPLDYSALNSGFTLGFKPEGGYSLGGTGAQSTSQDDYDYGGSGYGLATQSMTDLRPRLADGGVPGIRRYADASIGGVKGNQDQQPQIAQDPAAQQAPQEQAPSQQITSGIEELSKRDPNTASSITRNVFGMSNKDFQKLTGALAMVDFVNERTTADGLAGTMEKLRVIQSEGVMRAAQQVLAGNYDKAKAMFSEFGDDDGKTIDTFEKMKFANPVAGAAKGTKDSYEGFRIKYTDGSSMVVDPRRLAIEIMGTKAAEEHDIQRQSNIRSTDASVYNSDQIAEANRNKREELAQQKQQQLSLSFNQQMSTDMDREIKDEAKRRGADDILDVPGGKAIRDNIINKYRGGQTIGTMNILAGVMVSPQQAMDIAANLNEDFYRNKSNFRVGEDGKVVSGMVNGQLMLQTAAGVLVPAPQLSSRGQVKQSGTPDMPASQPDQPSATPAAQAAPQSLEEFRARQQQLADQQRVASEQAEAQRQQRHAELESSRKSAQAMYPMSKIKDLTADEANWIRDSDHFHLLTGEQQRAITRQVSFGAPSRKKTYGVTRN